MQFFPVYFIRECVCVCVCVCVLIHTKKERKCLKAKHCYTFLSFKIVPLSKLSRPIYRYHTIIPYVKNTRLKKKAGKMNKSNTFFTNAQEWVTLNKSYLTRNGTSWLSARGTLFSGCHWTASQNWRWPTGRPRRPKSACARPRASPTRIVEILSRNSILLFHR